jgi:hypothetical protein
MKAFRFDGEMNMARYQLLVAVEDGQWRYPASTKICDSVANQQAGDVVSAYWCASNHLTVDHVPLDASAVTAMQGAGFVTNGIGVRVGGAPCSITGADSVSA